MASHSDNLWQYLAQHESPDATYRPKSYPIILEKARGSEVFDTNGKAYIDLCAGFGVLAFGHNPTYVTNLLANQDDQIIHGLGDVYPSRDKIELLKALLGMMPSHLTKATFALTGAQAVEIALKTAMLATKRRRFLGFEQSYHGLDLGVLPVTFRQDFREPFQNYLSPGNAQHLPFACDLALVEEALLAADITGDSFAAVILEPLQGRGGVIPASQEWLSGLQKICKKHGVLVIFDEIFCGLGRAGRVSFAEEVPADIVCFGKALGGGFPVSACVATDAVMSAWPLCESEALHTGTFFGHPLSCRIASATLNEMAAANIIDQVRDTGIWLKTHLVEELSQFSNITAIRGTGLMLGIEFRQAGFGALLMDDLRARGVIAIPSGPTGNVLSITPALNCPRTLLRDAVSTLKSAIIALS